MHCTGLRFVGTCEFLFNIHLSLFDKQIMLNKYYFEQDNEHQRKDCLAR